ncbi:MAG: hypothetical protein MJ229_02805 [bacterium]|nr:hypothetical protein [bacterium]
MYKKIVCTLLVTSMISFAPAFADQNFQYSMPQQTSTNSNTLKGRLVKVQEGTTFQAVTSSAIGSAFMSEGQSVKAYLGTDFYANGTLIAPAGSTVSGFVVNVSKAKHGTISGSIKIRFTEIETSYGSRIPISAYIKTKDGTGVLRGATKATVAKEYTKDAVIGAGAGALTGLVAAAIGGGAIGQTTAIMTGVGAGVGLVKSGIDKGEDVEIPSGANIELILDQPITVSPNQNSYKY